MSIGIRESRKIAIWFLLVAFVVVVMILYAPTDSPDALPAVTFTLILILEILFVFSPNPQLPVCAIYHSGIRPRSPPNR